MCTKREGRSTNSTPAGTAPSGFTTTAGDGGSGAWPQPGTLSRSTRRCRRPTIDIFSGERTVNLFAADVSLVLYPLPRIPVLICYWEPEDGMESSLHIFFDDTAAQHLSVAWVHSLCAGLVAMFEKIALKHT